MQREKVPIGRVHQGFTRYCREICREAILHARRSRSDAKERIRFSIHDEGLARHAARIRKAEAIAVRSGVGTLRSVEATLIDARDELGLREEPIFVWRRRGPTSWAAIWTGELSNEEPFGYVGRLHVVLNAPPRPLIEGERDDVHPLRNDLDGEVPQTWEQQLRRLRNVGGLAVRVRHRDAAEDLLRGPLPDRLLGCSVRQVLRISEEVAIWFGVGIPRPRGSGFAG